MKKYAEIELLFMDFHKNTPSVLKNASNYFSFLVKTYALFPVSFLKMMLTKDWDGVIMNPFTNTI